MRNNPPRKDGPSFNQVVSGFVILVGTFIGLGIGASVVVEHLKERPPGELVMIGYVAFMATTFTVLGVAIFKRP